MPREYRSALSDPLSRNRGRFGSGVGLGHLMSFRRFRRRNFLVYECSASVDPSVCSCTYTSVRIFTASAVCVIKGKVKTTGRLVYVPVVFKTKK